MQAHYVDRDELGKLHNQDILEFPTSRPLNASRTLPGAFFPAFQAMEAELRRLWRPNAILQAAINATASHLAHRRDAQAGVMVGVHIR